MFSEQIINLLKIYNTLFKDELKDLANVAHNYRRSYYNNQNIEDGLNITEEFRDLIKNSKLQSSGPLFLAFLVILHQEAKEKLII